MQDDSSGDATLSFMKVEPSERSRSISQKSKLERTRSVSISQNMECLWEGENENMIVQRKRKSPSPSSSRKRKIETEFPVSLRKRQFLQTDSTPAPALSSKLRVSPQLQLVEIETSPLDQNEMMEVHQHDTLRLTEDPGQSVTDKLKTTQIEYQQGLCGWLNQMRKAEVGCDMHFLTPQDVLVVAHSYIVRSVPYFAAILDKQTNRSNKFAEPLCITVDASEEIIKNILDFLYTGTCNIDRTSVLMLLHQAALVQFGKLTDTCVQLIKKWGIVTPNNCFIVLKLLEDFPMDESCQELKEYVLGTLWEKKYLECVLLSKKLELILDLSHETFEIFLFRSVHNVDHDNLNFDLLFQCVKTWLSKYEEKLLGTKNEQNLRLLNTLSHRLLDCSSERASKFEIIVPKSEINGYTCEVPCWGATFELQFNVVADVDGDKWLGLSCDFKAESLTPTWYRAIGFGYTLLSEGCVFACCEGRSILFEKDFRKGVAGARRVIGMEDLFEPCNSYVNTNGNIRVEIRIEPDHICGFSIHHVIRNFQKIWDEHQDAILSLGINLLTFILQQDALNIDNEGLVLQIICLWLTDEYLDVELFEDSDIIELLSCVRWNFTNFKDLEKAFELIHNAGNGEALKHFHQCALKLTCSNDKPRQSYKDRSTNFQAWGSLFRSDWIVSSSFFRRMLELMLSLLEKLKSENIKPSRSEIEALISQEVQLHSSNVTHCVNFLESIISKYGGASEDTI